MLAAGFEIEHRYRGFNSRWWLLQNAYHVDMHVCMNASTGSKWMHLHALKSLSNHSSYTPDKFMVSFRSQSVSSPSRFRVALHPSKLDVIVPNAYPGQACRCSIHSEVCHRAAPHRIGVKCLRMLNIENRSSVHQPMMPYASNLKGL